MISCVCSVLVKHLCNEEKQMLFDLVTHIFTNFKLLSILQLTTTYDNNKLITKQDLTNGYAATYVTVADGDKLTEVSRFDMYFCESLWQY